MVCDRLHVVRTRPAHIDEDLKVRLAVERLGLSGVAHFEPKEKIIEYRVVGNRDEPLAGLKKSLTSP